MFDYHIHSDFSADCETPMEKTIEQAMKIGVEELCFTEHIDYEYPDESIVFEFNLDRYDKKIKEMQEAYGEQVRIKKGIEIGVQPHLLSRYESLMQKEVFDFVICSMHTTEKKDLHSGNFYKNYTIDEAFQLYYEELLYCVKNYKDFDVLGHVDLVKRYTKEKSSKDFHDILTEIFKEIIPQGKGIEWNTSGVRHGMKSAMPSIDIVKLYKECGGEIITIGSDSHVDSTLAYHYKDTLESLQSIGFDYVTTFSDRKPEFHLIQNLK
ncbi:histidinol-phosphatase (PHP family) [Virgibacillus natechei]|uniref:Histidinol-phosphatase n=1 Tax=Virgibacillus natechei TaxID=1216297 RepID=A0ABS4ICF9_9BACI|nr:histidinol-phosphatase HisJ family protein [Virgibacillus natechei]MBP1968543.1 histidinol-phosphatase (PHP family) [Virgibacillus natechei]UZD13658.1 histidinol-phosphatase HisJ family protein [Virgibacillus natechei]